MNKIRVIGEKFNHLVDNIDEVYYPELNMEHIDLVKLFLFNNKSTLDIKDFKHEKNYPVLVDFIKNYGFDLFIPSNKMIDCYRDIYMYAECKDRFYKTYFKEFLKKCYVELYDVYKKLKKDGCIKYESKRDYNGITYGFPLLDEYIIYLNNEIRFKFINKSETLVHELMHVYELIYLKNNPEALNNLNYGLLGEVLPLFVQFDYINYLKERSQAGAILENHFYYFALENFTKTSNFFDFEKYGNYEFKGTQFTIYDKDGNVVDKGSYINFVYTLSLLEMFKLYEKEKKEITTIDNYLNSLVNNKCYDNLLNENYNYDYFKNLVKKNMRDLKEYEKRA